MGRGDPPVVDPSSLSGEESTRPSVAGVLLAAGTSGRFGDANKLLAPLDGEPLVGHAARTLAESSLAGVTVVVGHEAGAVREAVDGLGVDVRENPDYGAGQGTSIGVGVRAAAAQEADAVLVALGDMPLVDPATVDLLVDAFAGSEATIVAAAFDGQRGNPVVFDSRHFEALADLGGATGGRSVLRAATDAICVETGDPGVVQDVDSRADIEELRERRS
jgi:molybdenum cofactor cytidylyltransferase